MTELNLLGILIPLVLLLLRTFPTSVHVLASTIPQDPDIAIAERQVPHRTNCSQNGDIECAPPTDWYWGVICCSPGNLCALSEQFDKEGAFHSYCVSDPQACLPGLFSCLPEINICCPDEYICNTRTWDNVTVPVCLSPLFHSNGTYTPPYPISISSTSQQQTTTLTTPITLTTPTTLTTPPTSHTQLPVPDNNTSGGGGAQGGNTSISKGVLAGLVVGVIFSSVLITFAVGFVLLRYRDRRRRRREEVPSGPGAADSTAKPVEPAAQPEPGPQTESKYSPPGPYHEADGLEILESGGRSRVVAELPGEPGNPKTLWNHERADERSGYNS